MFDLVKFVYGTQGQVIKLVFGKDTSHEATVENESQKNKKKRLGQLPLAASLAIIFEIENVTEMRMRPWFKRTLETVCAGMPYPVPFKTFEECSQVVFASIWALKEIHTIMKVKQCSKLEKTFAEHLEWGDDDVLILKQEAIVSIHSLDLVRQKVDKDFTRVCAMDLQSFKAQLATSQYRYLVWDCTSPMCVRHHGAECVLKGITTNDYLENEATYVEFGKKAAELEANASDQSQPSSPSGSGSSNDGTPQTTSASGQPGYTAV